MTSSSLYGDFQLANCSPPINILHLCRLLSVLSFFIFCAFTYVTFDDNSRMFDTLGIIIGLCVFAGLFYTVFKSKNKTFISLYVVYELFYVIMIVIYISFLLIVAFFDGHVDLGALLAVILIDFSFALIKVFFVSVFVILYKRIVIAERNLASIYHAQYFNGQVQINAFNNEVFPAPPPDFRFGMEHGYDLPPPRHDPSTLPTYESVMVVSKEREASTSGYASIPE